MKKSYLNILAAIIIIIFASLIVLSVRSSHEYSFADTAENTHAALISSNHFISPDDAQKLITSSDKSVIFIDVRNPREFDNFHLDGSKNIPMPQILDDTYKSLWETGTTKVLCGADSRQADQVRTLLVQFGYTNISVLHGGIDYWKHNMVSAGPFTSKAEYNDEILDTAALKAATGK